MSLEQELVEFVATSSTECNQLKRVIEEKDCTINSLLNEKTEQENTVLFALFRSISSRPRRKRRNDCTCNNFQC